MADHIIQKKNESTWYVRLDVPKDVRRTLGNRTVLIQSLKTGMRSEAMVRRLPILAQWKAAIDAARAAKVNSGDEWRLAQHELGKQLQRKQNDGVSLLFTPINLDIVPDRPDDSFLEKLLEWAKAAELMGEHKLASRITDHIKKFNDACERGMTPADGIVLHHNLLSIQADGEASIAAYEYNLSDEERQEAQAIAHNPTLYKPRSPISKSMIEQWSKHLVTQIKTEKTRDVHKARIEKISKYLTDEGAPLNFDTIHNFITEQSGARKTLTNYLWSGRDFWKWANKYSIQFREQFIGQPCPFDGHDLPKVGKDAGESYIPFTRKEVEQLYKKAKEDGKDNLANLIVFGAYTGSRLEEIGRTKTADTIYDNDGEPIGFKILESKTGAGVREVPIHPSLVPLYKQLCSQASSNDGYLFKGGNNKYGNRLDYLAKQFSQLKNKAEFSDLHVFHSIRKTTTTELHQAGVGLEVLPYILGHENKSFTLSYYSKGCSFEQKVKAIQLLNFEFKNS
ncbi:tyrosine-type recombinase/integrase [Pseudomonas sp. SG20052]|uniref:tyrosine-type recombinase/integrase n=1 Tax=Pseudomonas sp. SG20052 TaxID=3074147 RepID=UPI00287FC419|nr:tyrosine-type recombinase/integrase [Pseudomonas sp. SG20052]WNF54031.1 tyrosine-type recombinase/integrase [Pseudomonas sp. SG20052]